MNKKIEEMMEFIEQFANDGGGSVFNIRSVWRSYTGQKVGRLTKLRVNGIHMSLMGIALKKLKEQGKVKKIADRRVWKWINGSKRDKTGPEVQ